MKKDRPPASPRRPQANVISTPDFKDAVLELRLAEKDALGIPPSASEAIRRAVFEKRDRIRRRNAGRAH